MSAVVSSSSGGRGNESQDFELNLASIIDCFTVLITFMLASASFLSIGILDAGVAATSAAPTNATPPAIQVTVSLTPDQKFEVKVNGKANSTNSIPAVNGKPDFDALNANLSNWKSKFSDLSAITLTADNTVEYQNVIKTMEMTRKVIPVVLLGGF